MFTDDDETIKLIDEMESIKMAESPLPPPKKKKKNEMMKKNEIDEKTMILKHDVKQMKK